MRKRFLSGFIFFIIALVLGWQLGVQVERKTTEVRLAEMEAKFALSGSGVTFLEDPEEEVDLSIMWTVWRLLDKYYVDPEELSIDQMRFGAVSGLVSSMGDPYSAFMTPKESTDFHQALGDSEFGGIGAELTVRSGQIVVVAPLRGTPAAQSGLRPMDIILEVDSVSVEGMDLHAVVDLIRGEKGTDVILNIFRPSETKKMDISITRDQILVPSVEYEIIETGTGSVGYIALNKFGDETVQDSREALNSFENKDIAGILLDLRFNGGGYLDGAIDIASFFLQTEKILSVHRRGEEIESHFAYGSPITPDMPVVVLINEGSASASEIVAGALQDHSRAKVVGASSFGKGTVQEVMDLPGGSSLRVTVAKWKTPGGRDIGKEGIEPDLMVDMTVDDIAEGLDPQKEAAMRLLFDEDL
ncbi:PDZ domain-containing protein [Candidatus Peribacteria bacterium]|jgi:carboxyl-terminal processing protease|nr:PDZ domain-containing protein [Candidatus Peribacteria bacterium]MBT4020824.1 PDZ domain-containing protein [Candidatus Peribacteria bacterium]MBT4240357.1 PDZ domain-containing protein [Candidatus Peribacteria bacterium]MBT4474643.1 PDZ domain-containing protein [Candidatus Peribacteria bacterium]